MTKVTVAPFTSTGKGLHSEVPVGPANGPDDDCAVALDNLPAVPVSVSSSRSTCTTYTPGTP
ncbi:hypothetical protein [Corynebacterium neomassiliense]